MKNKQLFSFRLVMFLLFTQLWGCYKLDIDDLWHKHNPNCRIEKMIIYSDFDTARTGIFKYNHKGNPVSITFDRVSTGLANFMFLYDNKHRLKDYLAHYNGSYQLWYRYTYDSRNRVISDTLHHFGTVENGIPVPNPYYKFYGDYEYDAYGRVSKVVRYRIDYFSGATEFLYTESYNYNIHGNLVSYRQTNPLPSIEILYDQYDNKVNFHQTNKVWMFVDRNYSRNNLYGATHYNSKGLPLQFDVPQTNYFSFLWEVILNRSEIFYSCNH